MQIYNNLYFNKKKNEGKTYKLKNVVFFCTKSTVTPPINKIIIKNNIKKKKLYLIGG